MPDNEPAIIIAPDSYKGSLSAPEVARSIRDGMCGFVPESAIRILPMADGGEGTLDCVAACCPGQRHTLVTTGIHDRRVTADWFMGADGTAYLEAAQVLGLPLMDTVPDAPPLKHRGSGALGELIRAALDAGASSLVVGLGGSACNDAGLGLLTTLGARAFDSDGHPLSGTLGGLLSLATINCTGLDPRLTAIETQVLCDVNNPLLGEYGASRVYGPQKGLAISDIEAADAACKRLSQTLDAADAARQSGAGAAGGLGFALAAIGGRLMPGARTLLRHTDPRNSLAQADLVITGEGRTDAQTLTGKTPLAVAQAASSARTVLVSGEIDSEIRSRLPACFGTCYSLAERAGSTSAARADPARWLRSIGAEIGRLHTEDSL